MRFYRSTRVRFFLSAVVVAALVLSLIVFKLADTTQTGFASLPNSSFESRDGNLAVDTAGNVDWANAPNRRAGAEKASGQGDDAFGGGAKEDLPNPKVVSGSIPNNKSDLTRFYVANETVLANNQAKTFLYLAWERANTLGSANIDFEFNQSVVTGPNSVTPVRTAGDVLITYDFQQGGATPALGLLRWITDPSLAGQCFSSNAVPCWGSRIDLSAAGFAEGAINSAATTDPIPDPDTALPELTFGEAAIDLNAAGVVKANECVHFGRAFVKSRSSTSFPAELKDFIAPIPVNIDTCGSLKILKVDDQTPGNPLAGATFAITPDPGTGSGSLTVTDGATGDADGVANGEVIIAKVLPNQYTVTETTAPAGWVGSSATINITAGTSGEVTVGPFVNTLGSIAWEKRDDKGNLLGGATFSISPNPYACWGGSLASIADNSTSDKDADAGQFKIERVCVGKTYTITETGAPPGYALETSPSRTVTPTTSAPNQTIGTQGTNDSNPDFHDRPLLKLQVQVVREDDGAVVDSVTLSLSSLSTSNCTFTGTATQTQAVSPTPKTGVWNSLNYGCLSNGPGYQVTIKTPN